MSKNPVTYTKRRVSYGVLSHFIVALLLLFRSVHVSENLVCGSDFEDVVFQTGMMMNGWIKGVLSGSHYNSARIGHKIVSDALQRLLLIRFLAVVSGENIHWLE